MERKKDDDVGYLGHIELLRGAVEETRLRRARVQQYSGTSFLLDEVDAEVIAQAKGICGRFFEGKGFREEIIIYMANILKADDFNDLTILLDAIAHYAPQKLDDYDAMQTTVILLSVGCFENEIDLYLEFLGLPVYGHLPKKLQEFFEPRIHDFMPVEARTVNVRDDIREEALRIMPPRSPYGPN